MRSIKFPPVGLFITIMIMGTVGAVAQPALIPFTPSGWSGPVVVSNNQLNDTNATSSDFLTTDNLYVSWSIFNSGDADISSTFDVDLYVDGVVSQTLPIAGLPAGYYEFFNNYSIGSLSAGTHQVALVADPGHTLAGVDESTNAYTNTITVAAVILPAPTPQTPANGSAGQFYVPMF